ncbi:MAG TPA: site-specific integrase [Nitrososphaeraceae archaeon]
MLQQYLTAMRMEGSSNPHYERDISHTINSIERFASKDIKNVTTADILNFLNHFKKAEEIDPLHKWIGTYNIHLNRLVKFFKWLYYPNLPARERPRPPIVANLRTIKRREKSIYKPTDIWSQEDDLLFLKYCPSKRDRCYHAISRDSSCRPVEILRLKIKDVVFKLAGNRQYAEVLVNGKTGSRHIPLINSIPYLKDWLDEHPFKTNPNIHLICGFGKSLGRQTKEIQWWKIYNKYKTEVFPKFLENPNINPEDKQKIKKLLTKPWNPYIRRHSALTEKSKILKESILRQHAGWTNDSKMPNIYLHYFGNESNESILEAYGLKTKSESIDIMKPVQCPNCGESCKIDSRFCPKCRMVLTYDAYSETIEQKESDITILMRKIDALEESQREIRECMKHPDKLLKIANED